MVRKKTEKEYLIDSAIELFSKNDIVARCFVEITSAYYAKHRNSMTLHTLLLYMSEEVCSHAGFFRHAFAYKGQNNIHFSLARPLQDLLTDLYIKENRHNPDTSAEHAMRFFINGILAYVEQAIALNEIPSAKESVAFFENALPAVLKQAFNI